MIGVYEATWSNHMALRFINDYPITRLGLRLCHLHDETPDKCTNKGKR